MAHALRRFGIYAVVALVAVIAGCPGEDGDGRAVEDGGASLGAGEPDFRVCDAHQGWVQRCMDDPEFGGEPGWAETECRTEIPWRLVEPAYIEANAACLGTLACDGTDDSCYEEGLAAIGITSEADIADDELIQRCLARVDACDGLSGDVCTLFLVLTDAGRDAAAHCLDVACDRFRSCLAALDES